jgi:hypothetical protein
MYLKVLVAAAVTTFVLSSPVYAADAGPGHRPEAANGNAFQNGLPPGLSNRDRGPGNSDNGRRGRPHEPAIAQVPELGGASAGLALLLLGGLIALRRETRRPS